MRKQKVITLILLGVFLVGLSLLLYPSVSNYWNSITQSRAIVDYDTIVKSLSPKDYTAYFERAEEYNSELKALPFPLMEYQQISGYDDCLNAAGDGVIGYIDIDKIQVKLPIYHGTDPSMLNHACGHIQGSSFPIAGKGYPCGYLGTPGPAQRKAVLGSGQAGGGRHLPDHGAGQGLYL